MQESIPEIEASHPAPVVEITPTVLERQLLYAAYNAVQSGNVGDSYNLIRCLGALRNIYSPKRQEPLAKPKAEEPPAYVPPKQPAAPAKISWGPGGSPETKIAAESRNFDASVQRQPAPQQPQPQPQQMQEYHAVSGQPPIQAQPVTVQQVRQQPLTAEQQLQILLHEQERQLAGRTPYPAGAVATAPATQYFM